LPSAANSFAECVRHGAFHPFAGIARGNEARDHTPCTREVSPDIRYLGRRRGRQLSSVSAVCLVCTAAREKLGSNDIGGLNDSKSRQSILELGLEAAAQWQKFI
jgi:hypothetical protein